MLLQRAACSPQETTFQSQRKPVQPKLKEEQFLLFFFKTYLQSQPMDCLQQLTSDHTVSMNTIITNPTSGTNITQIAEKVYHISTPVPPNPGLPAGFSFNQLLIIDEKPLLFQTGLKSLFPLVKQAIETVIPVNKLRYIAFSHFEADECGAMNEFLQEATESVAVCSTLGKNVTVDDQLIRPAKGMEDNEILSLGRKEIQWLYTPHTPHGWDCSFAFETTSKLLLGGDLFTQVGNTKPALVENDYNVLFGENMYDLSFWSRTPRTQEYLKRMANLNPQLVYNMHGSSYKGDVKGALGRLATVLQE